MLKDDWFPFSHYPMYSRFHDEVTVLYLADTEGDPLPMGDMVGLTSAKAGKIFHASLKDECARRRVKISTASPEVLQAAAATFAGVMRERNAEGDRPPLPGRFRVVQITLALKEGKLSQSHRVIGEV